LQEFKLTLSMKGMKWDQMMKQQDESHTIWRGLCDGKSEPIWLEDQNSEKG
jgi:hypothetical protein